MVEKVQHWFDRANLFAPKRNKRGKKDCQEKHTMEEVVNLIEESPSIPMDTHVEVGRLRMLLSDVQSWRIQVHCELREIANSFKLLREARIGYYGEPEKFIESMMNGNKDSTSLIEDCPEQPLASIEDCQNQNMPVKILLSGGKNVYKMVANVVKSAESVNVVSFEEEVTQNLQNVAHWCKEAAKIIASPIDVFIDKMKLEDLVELINSGENLLSQESELESKKDQFDDEDLIVDLNKSWKTLASDDITRLKQLRLRREEFKEWCKKVKDLLDDKEKKIQLDDLKKLAEESKIYPPNADTVKQLQKDAKNAIDYADEAGKLIASGKAIHFEHAKDIVNQGTNLNITCPELKTLRNAIRITRGWANRVKKCGLHESSAQINQIKELVKEYDTFLVCLPDEVSNLKQAMCSYCICRRPYEGFMIGCDECDDWYHGHCIGV